MSAFSEIACETYPEIHKSQLLSFSTPCYNFENVRLIFVCFCSGIIHNRKGCVL